MAYIPANRDVLLSEHVITQLSNSTGYATKTVSSILNQFSEFIVDALCAGYNVDLSGFGTFYLQKHKGHTTPHMGKMDDYATLKFYPDTNVRDDLKRRKERQAIIWTKEDVDDPVLQARCVRSVGRPSSRDEDMDLSECCVLDDLCIVNNRIQKLKGVGTNG